MVLDDIVVLEDDEDLIRLFECVLENIQLKHIFKNSEELKMFLDEGNRAKKYYLDDYIHGKKSFVNNVLEIIKHDSNAKIFYVGATPESRDLAFCLKYNFGVIHKNSLVSNPNIFYS